MNIEQLAWIQKSIEMINSGITNKVISTDKTIQVYKCGTVIRIDIKSK